MNPFTKSISARLRSAQLRVFIEHWDALEALIVRTFKAREASAADAQAYPELRHWLTENYPAWREALTPLWKTALRGGQPSPDDPFEYLLQPESAEAFARSWVHMQALPAARESLNRLVLDTNAKSDAKSGTGAA